MPDTSGNEGSSARSEPPYKLIAAAGGVGEEVGQLLHDLGYPLESRPRRPGEAGIAVERGQAAKEKACRDR